MRSLLLLLAAAVALAAGAAPDATALGAADAGGRGPTMAGGEASRAELARWVAAARALDPDLMKARRLAGAASHLLRLPRRLCSTTATAAAASAPGTPPAPPPLRPPPQIAPSAPFEAGLASPCWHQAATAPAAAAAAEPAGTGRRLRCLPAFLLAGAFHAHGPSLRRRLAAHPSLRFGDLGRGGDQVFR